MQLRSSSTRDTSDGISYKFFRYSTTWSSKYSKVRLRHDTRNETNYITRVRNTDDSKR